MEEPPHGISNECTPQLPYKPYILVIYDITEEDTCGNFSTLHNNDNQDPMSFFEDLTPLEMNMLLPEPNDLQRKKIPKREPTKSIYGFMLRFHNLLQGITWYRKLKKFQGKDDPGGVFLEDYLHSSRVNARVNREIIEERRKNKETPDSTDERPILERLYNYFNEQK